MRLALLLPCPCFGPEHRRNQARFQCSNLAGVFRRILPSRHEHVPVALVPDEFLEATHNQQLLNRLRSEAALGTVVVELHLRGGRDRSYE
jgi:hypothetical protein